MKLDFIELDNLKLSPLNARKHGNKSGDDLIASIKANGIIQPLLVRPNCDGYEIVAGQRRYNACHTIAKSKKVDPLPCAIMEDGDDVKAIEASLAENIDRLPMDEIDQYGAFRHLVKQGRCVEEIASHFGVTERLVKQRLAIANLYNPILNAYRREEIDPRTIRLLTMASVKQQKKWFKLFKEDEAPQHWQLKSWLFGGEEIPTSNALFDLETYKGVITSDLFGEDNYFADPDLFWEYQSRAIAEIKTDLEEDGWKEIILLDVGQHWQRWEHSEVYKEDGGNVYIEVRSNGEVTIHKGLLPQKEAKRLAAAQAGEESEKTERPELTQSMQNYLDLHRHAAVRTELLGHPGIALRLAVAQMIAGSTLIEAKADPQKANTDAIRESLATNSAETSFAKERGEIRQLLQLVDEEGYTIVPAKGDWGAVRDLHAIFATLLELDDDTVSRILTFVIAECLPCGSDMVEQLGCLMNVDMSNHWQLKHEETQRVFFELFKDKEAINAMVKEVAGKNAADGNITATAKVQKQIVQHCLTGERKAKVDVGTWQPKYMHFPMQGYTKRQDTISAVKAGKELEGKF